MSYIGLDIGTSGCKAVAFSAAGRELASAYREYPLLQPHAGWAELDSDRVMQACFDCIRTVNGALGGDPAEALAVSSQGEAFTAVDAAGRPLCNAMVSSDGRARELVRPFSDAFGPERVYRITGHTPHTLFTLFKLLWLKRNRPDVWQSARYFLCFEDLFQRYVGLESCISWSLAGRTLLFDVERHRWSPEILEALGLEADRLARPVPSGQVAGVIDPETARSLGFRGETPVVAGGHDQGCSALGAGIIRPGMCMYATGTVECFCPMLEEMSFTETLRRNNLCCYDYTVAGRYTTVAYSLTGGNILRWVRDVLGAEERAEAAEKGVDPYTLLLDRMPEEPTDLYALPYFSPSGTPYFDAELPGALLGLRLSTTKGEMIKAFLEGVAFEMKLNLALMEQSGMQIDTFVATGGGTRDPRWTQLKADVLGKPVVVREAAEAGCFGAAMLACAARTGQSVEACVAGAVTDKCRFVPDPRRAARYDRKFETYRSLYPTLKTLAL